MHRRNYTSANGSYRFGFNGKEKDDELKGEGNQQDYGMRIYDPRLGRFLSLDPLASDYPWNSPYAFAENDVIRSVDLDGQEKVIISSKANSRSQTVMKLISKNSFLSDLTFNRKDRFDRAKNDLIIITVGNIHMTYNATANAHLVNITNSAQAYRDNVNKRDLISKTNVKNAKGNFDKAGFADYDLLMSNQAPNIYALVIDEKYFKNAGISELTQVVMHELIAHYYNNQKNGDKGVADHLAFFGIDAKNPYGDKFYDKKEIDGILGNDENYKGASISPKRYKPGSMAYKIQQEVKKSIEQQKE